MADVNTRPTFYLPFPAGTSVAVKSYVGHDPDHKKMDMYAADWPHVVAAASGVVHEWFEPGGIEIRHYIPGTQRLGNWYTTYMHMSDRAAVGTHVDKGHWVGDAGSVGTWVKHLHHEQLHDASGSGNAQTDDMVFPAFMEYLNGHPFHVPVGEPGLRLVSKNRRREDTSPKPNDGGDHQTGKIWQGEPVPDLIRKGSGQYLGLISGPAASHGGVTENERHIVRKLQQRLIACGFVPGVSGVHSDWADGKFQKATADAVTRFQRKHMSGTQYFGQVWSDDWQKLFNL